MALDREEIPTPSTIREWQQSVHRLARAKGWHDGGRPIDNVWKYLGNIHSEASEAWEIARRHDFDPGRAMYRADGKPEGFGSELADIVIRVLDTAEALGIDMQREMSEKHAYNYTRPQRHGGKRA